MRQMKIRLVGHMVQRQSMKEALQQQQLKISFRLLAVEFVDMKS